MIDEDLQKFSESRVMRTIAIDDTDDDEQSNIDIVVAQLETAGGSGEEEENDKILNHDNDDLPCNTAGEIEAHSKKKFECS
ncbi:hypothetical protein AVEN_27536-1 [Araneus ventricosus]|uniref:Uncharacterized protein n=1 Tax=Araneus ventricosus TaxID=182803 RepID=A0A4Y2NR16_ARAVE|nr:hypothetical protein AVEN_27536-1 [Araneus ventricosus]